MGFISHLCRCQGDGEEVSPTMGILSVRRRARGKGDQGFKGFSSRAFTSPSIKHAIRRQKRHSTKAEATPCLCVECTGWRETICVLCLSVLGMESCKKPDLVGTQRGVRAEFCARHQREGILLAAFHWRLMLGRNVLIRGFFSLSFKWMQTTGVFLYSVFFNNSG